jgi:adenylate cyclase class 2
MPMEIEAKLKVESHAPVRRRLTELRGEHVGRSLEVDTFFDRPDGSLFAKDQGLRVRLSQPVEGQQTSSTMTYKGATQPGAFKARSELEMTVADAEVACRILESLGFKRVLRFEKWRERWKLAGCMVELDELPMLGCYVEIEGPSEGSVQAVREQIVLTGTDPIKTSYLGLLIDVLKEKGLKTHEVRFEEG